MKIYISGPISNIPDGNISAFTEAEIALQAKYPEAKIFNPHRNGLSKYAPWAEHMRADIKMLMDCDCLCLLPGWNQSTGVALELKNACAIGMCVAAIDHWLA